MQRRKETCGDTVRCMTVTAGQSFGAFLARGVSFELIGAGNDYVAKGACRAYIASSVRRMRPDHRRGFDHRPATPCST